MPINKAIFAAISRLMPNAKHSYKIQRIMDGATARMESNLKHICDIQDVQLPLLDGTMMTIRVCTPLLAREEYRYSELYQADKKTLKELARQHKQEHQARPDPHEDARDKNDSAAPTKPHSTPEEHDHTAHANQSDHEPHAPALAGDILFIHGGGWATGSAGLYTDVCANLALQTQRRVFAVDYRLAPDNRYPTPFNDCYAAARAFFDGSMPVPNVPGTQPTINPDTALIFGDSAGGNLCAALALKGRDTGDFTVPTMILLYPCLNNDYNMATSPYDSVRTNGKDYLLTAQDMADYLNMYRSNVPDLLDPYFAPLNERDLTRQPRTLIISAEYCPLRDEDEEYARRLKAAGNEVACYRIHDGVHGYIMYPRISPLVVNTYRIIDHFLDADHDLHDQHNRQGKEQQAWERIVGID